MVPQRMPMILADVRLSWLPPISGERLAVYALAAAAAVLALRVLAGGPSRAARSWPLLAMRGLIFAALLALLLNPVRVETTPGAFDRPEVVFAYDASESMALGEPDSRWESVGKLLAAADGELRASSARVVPYSFGRKLKAVEVEPVSATGGPAAEPPGAVAAFGTLSPGEPDTQLGAALRQLTGRVGRVPPAGVVLFSDGRTRDPEAALAAAATFGKLKVPIHVVPTGDGAGGGDVAIVGVAAPERVRKFSENQVTVFLRSFGYDGRRVEVTVAAASEGRSPEQPLSSSPVTLTGGVQSVTLPFRSELRSRTLRVSVAPGEDEVTQANNRFDFEVEVDRTKIRVLYLEGSDDPVQTVPRGDILELRGPHSGLQEALSEDPDIECVTSVTGGQGALRLVDRQMRGSMTTRGFPATTAELFAYDAIILSNVSRDLLTDEQIERLERWIGRRGGGLCMVGGRKAFSDGYWRESPLAAMLPVALPERGTFDPGPVTLRPAEGAANHPLWRISEDATLNRGLLDAIPATPGHQGPLVPKPDAGETIGVADGTNGALVVAGRYGRGRTLAVSPVIAAPPGSDALQTEWGGTPGAYFGKLWRNAVYWLTENSSIGRRRLLVETDKRFYRPEETVAIRADAFDEAADKTDAYRVVAMIEPKSLDFDLDSLDSPLLWPEGRPRTSGEDGPYLTWGEEIELRPGADGRYELDLAIAAPVDETADVPAVRVELTAYEGQTQVDSTSVDVQILDDPFERRNPFPDHDLLARVASAAGGRVFTSAEDLTDWVEGLPVRVGPETVRREPVWDCWPILLGLLGLVTADWLWRRKVGLA